MTGWSPGQRRLFNSSGETSDSAVASAVRYWRMLATAVDGGSSIDLAEIEMRTALGGVDQTGSGTANNGNSANTSGNTPANAVDNNSTTKWQTNSIAGWWYYDFGSGVTKDIQEVAITASAVPTNSPKTFLIQRSDDAVRWATGMSLTGITGWVSGQTRYFASTGETSGSSPVSTRPVVFVAT
jgi:hypothetical protein